MTLKHQVTFKGRMSHLVEFAKSQETWTELRKSDQ